MPNDDRTKIIRSRTPESAAMLANVKRAMAITATLNRLTFNDADEIRALFSELIGKKVDESFLLIPPFYTAGGDEIRVGQKIAPLPANLDQIAAIRAVTVEKNHQLLRGAGFRLHSWTVDGRRHIACLFCFRPYARMVLRVPRERSRGSPATQRGARA